MSESAISSESKSWRLSKEALIGLGMRLPDGVVVEEMEVVDAVERCVRVERECRGVVSAEYSIIANDGQTCIQLHRINEEVVNTH